MIITPEFICIHLQKCAGSFLRTYFLENIAGAKYTGTPHDQVKDIPRIHRRKPIIGTIRNPWEWYVSWYAGTQRNPQGHFWQLHKNGTNTTFYEFMDTVKSIQHKIHNVDFGLINRLQMGVYTYRYIESYCTNPQVVFQTWPICSGTNLIEDNIYLCKTERLIHDIIEFFITRNIPLNDDQIDKLKTTPMINQSTHQPYGDYYDDKLVKYVTNNDQYLVQKFEYKFV